MVRTLNDPGATVFEPDPRSRFGREAWGCAFWLVAIVCAAGGAFSVWHLRTLESNSETTRATVVFQEGTADRPLYMYDFTVGDRKFRGTWVGPEEPRYEVGGTMPVAYYRPNPQLNNGGTKLEHPPLENPTGWFNGAGVAALLGLWNLWIAKFAPKEFPWS